MQIDFEEARVRVEPAGGGKSRIEVDANSPHVRIPRTRWETAYPVDLIEAIARVKGPSWLCDEIMRDEQPTYVQRHVEFDILSYLPAQWFAGKRVLDFGCGCGASTVVMARMMPGATFTGVELLEEYTRIARRRAQYYGFDNVAFITSPDPNHLPPDTGMFDAIVLSAVWEHLLPEERPRLLRLLWSRLRPGGVLFIHETPHRWWPVEAHTTGIPLLNYLPDALALAAAKRLSPRVGPQMTWPDLLRKGIRGGTPREIMGLLRKAGHTATLLDPAADGMRDRIDLWYRMSSGFGRPAVKSATRTTLKALKALTGVSLVPYLSLAIRKEGTTS